MSCRVPVTLATFTLLALAVLHVPASHAQWAPDGVRVPGLNGWQRVAIPDGAGGMVIVSLGGSSNPNSDWDVQAQRITHDGRVAPGWPTASAFLCTADGAQVSPQAVPDGSGGALVAWVDHRDTLSTDLYMHRIRGDGALAPGWPANGLMVVPDRGTGSEYGLVEDGLGGAFLIWMTGAADKVIRATHLTPGGEWDPAWPAAGIVLCAAPGGRSLPRACADGAGGAYVTWEDLRGGSGQPQGFDVYAQHFTASGTLVTGWPANGVAVSAALGDQDVQVVSPGAAGDLFVSWLDKRNGNLDAYALRLRADGSVAPGWTIGGSPVVTQAANQFYPLIVPDAVGGALIVWSDIRSGDFDVYGQHLRDDGAVDPAWPGDGLGICLAPGFQYPTCITDGNGGLYVCWQDNRDYATRLTDVYASHLGADGSVFVGWPANGLAISATPEYQDSPQLVSDGAGGALVSWADSRYPGGVWASRIGAQGIASVDPLAGAVSGLALSSPWPNPSRGRLTFRAAFAGTERARLQLVDIVGRVVLARELGVMPGARTVTLDTDGLPAGVYHAVLVQGARSTSVRAAVLR